MNAKAKDAVVVRDYEWSADCVIYGEPVFLTANGTSQVYRLVKKHVKAGDSLQQRLTLEKQNEKG